MAGELARHLDGIRTVDDAATRDVIYPLATRQQDQRVYNKGTGGFERWNGSTWVSDPSALSGLTSLGVAGPLTVTRTTEPLRLAYSASLFTSVAVTTLGGLVITPQPNQAVSVTSFAASGPTSLSAQTRVGDLLRVEQSPFTDTTGLQGAGIELFCNPTDGCQIWAYNRTTLAGIPLRFQGGPITFSPAVTLSTGATITTGGLTVTAGDVVVSNAALEGVQWSGVARMRWDGSAYMEVTNLTASAYVSLGVKDLYVHGKFGANNTAPIAKPTVTGSKGANAALASLLTALAAYGLVTDSST